MKLTELTELHRLHESAMSDLHIDLQEKVMKIFGFGDTEAEQVLDFALGNTEWEDLGQDSRERLMSHYEHTMPYGTAKARTGDPVEFISKSLTKELGL